MSSSTCCEIFHHMFYRLRIFELVYMLYNLVFWLLDVLIMEGD